MTQADLVNRISQLEARLAAGERRTTQAPVRFALPMAVNGSGWLVKITGNATGGGKYTGTIWKMGSGDVATTGNLAEGDLGTTGDSCLILNVREVGQSTHDLQSSSYLPLIVPAVLVRVNADGTKVFAINTDQWEDCPEA